MFINHSRDGFFSKSYFQQANNIFTDLSDAMQL